MTTLRIAFVVGARPEFVQVGALVRALPAWNELNPSSQIVGSIIHTGQHYDSDMSDVFFRELSLPRPKHALGVGSATQSVQIGRMLEQLDPVLATMAPDFVLIFGDTNSTLAGALVASKQRLALAHVEAGLRSFNMAMPEEMNRRVADHMATMLFCPSPTAVQNLAAEGITSNVHLTGDVMFEAMLHSAPTDQESKLTLTRHGVKRGEYAIATIHRAENTDDFRRLNELIDGLTKVAAGGLSVIVPLHPRTRRALESLPHLDALTLTDPVGHREMLALAAHAKVGLTDSGGLQKELYWLGTPCVTMRDETEWTETVTNGWNVLTGADSVAIADAVAETQEGAKPERKPLYGEDGLASARILGLLTGVEPIAGLTV